MKKFFAMLGKVILYLGIYFATSMLTISILSLLISKDTRDWINGNPSSMLIVINVITIALYYLILRLMKKDLFKLCELRKFNPKFLIFTIPMGISLGIFSTSIVKTSFVINEFPGLVTALNNIVTGDIALIVFFGTIIMGSILEEILFRGLVLNELVKKMPVAVAILLQGLLFGLILGDIPVALYACLGAVVFSVIYLWSGSLWTSIITHVISSSCIYIFTRVYDSSIKEATIPYFLGASLLVLITTVALMWKYKDRLTMESNEASAISKDS